MTGVEMSYERERAGGGWSWLLVVTGIVWILIGLFALEADLNSALLIGYLVAVWLLFAGVAEFVGLVAVTSWKWLHVVFGVAFLLGGVAALMSPFQTFTILAGLLGFFLVVKGSFDLVIALHARHVVDLWWLTLILALLEIVLGVWATGYPGRSAALLVLWVGVGAIVRGVYDIVSAFSSRLGPEVAVA